MIHLVVLTYHTNCFNYIVEVLVAKHIQNFTK